MVPRFVSKVITWNPDRGGSAVGRPTSTMPSGSGESEGEGVADGSAVAVELPVADGSTLGVVVGWGNCSG
jgi:hypothetical protein